MKEMKWLVTWVLQILTMMILGVLIALVEWFGGGLHDVALWGLSPIIGAVSAYRATRRGLLNYAAWLAPPACVAVSQWLVWGFLPQPGPVLLCAFISLVGAAAGEVRKREQK